MKLAVLGSVLALVTLAAPAHADPEMQTIECSGTLYGGPLSMPASGPWTGHLNCTLGYLDTREYDPAMSSFGSDVSAYVSGVPTAVPGVVWVGGDVLFSDGRVNYDLRFDDPAQTATDDLYMVDDDKVWFGNGLVWYHVRYGEIGNCDALCHPAGSPATPTTMSYGISFTAEFGYDLPGPAPVG
jgi:hypothetical protein